MGAYTLTVCPAEALSGGVMDGNCASTGDSESQHRRRRRSLVNATV